MMKLIFLLLPLMVIGIFLKEFFKWFFNNKNNMKKKKKQYMSWIKGMQEILETLTKNTEPPEFITFRNNLTGTTDTVELPKNDKQRKALLRKISKMT